MKSVVNNDFFSWEKSSIGELGPNIKDALIGILSGGRNDPENWQEILGDSYTNQMLTDSAVFGNPEDLERALEFIGKIEGQGKDKWTILSEVPG